MKFLDQAKIFVRSGNGAPALLASDVKHMCLLAALMVVMAAEAAMLWHVVLAG